MSYCRFSCLNYYSDVYVYEGEDNYVTHVAGMRSPPGRPYCGTELLLSVMGENHPATEIYRAAQEIADAWAKENPAQPIEHPFAGQTFYHDSPSECAEFLQELGKAGFIVPYWAIMSLCEESRAALQETDK